MEDYLYKELYLGCKCTDLDHISCFNFFPLTEKEKKYGEKDKIYLSIKLNNYYNRFFPQIKYIFDINEWKDVFYYNFLHRIRIGLKNIFNLYYYKKYGIFQSIMYQNKDLESLYKFLSQITEFENKEITHQSNTWTENNKWSIRFYMENDISGNIQSPYRLYLEIQFQQPVRWYREITASLKYILGLHSTQQSFEINRFKAEDLKGMIKWILKQNVIIKKKEKETIRKTKEEENGTNNK
jgi:hypothetical protein